jgi:hypothetical protein
MRYERPVKLEGDKPRGPFEDEDADAGAAPVAAPGRYQVQLVVGETTLTEPFTIVKDPRLPASDADLRKLFALKLAIRDRLNETREAVNQLRRVRKQLEGWEERATSLGGGSGERLTAAIKPLQEQLTAAEGAFINLDAAKLVPGAAKLDDRLCTLSGMIDESDDQPTQAATEVFAAISEDAGVALSAWHRLRDGAVREFNELVRTLDLPAIGV